MSNHNINIAIERSKAVLAALIESHEQLGCSDVESNLFVIQSYLCDASQSFLDSTPSENEGFVSEVPDAVSGALLNINKILVTASRYSDACFTDEDSEDENYIMFRLLIDFASEAYRRLKVAESELFK